MVENNNDQIKSHTNANITSLCFNINPLFDLIFGFSIPSYATFCRNKLEFVVFLHFPFCEMLNPVITFHKAGIILL